MLHLTPERKIHFTLRFAIAMCFIGHGAFGIITKAVWCNYFAVFGIGRDLAYRLMPMLGTFDIVLGITMLIYPIRIIPLWLVLWGVVTALLRPLSGEPFPEFIERAGNFGVPLALLLLSGSVKNIRGWFTPIDPDKHSSTETFSRVMWCLRIVVFLLLIGHGWLNLIEKESLVNQYLTLGFTSPGNTAQTVGLFEIIAGCAILIRPYRPLLLLILLWKMTSELFYPNYELFEWLERGGSYGAIWALWIMIRRTPIHTIGPSTLSIGIN